MNFGLRLNELLNSGDGILHCCGDYQDEAKANITSLIKRTGGGREAIWQEAIQGAH